MSTRSSSRMAPKCTPPPTVSPRRRDTGFKPARSLLRKLLFVSMAGCLLPSLTSCGMSQGALLYTLGGGRGKIIKARFRLTTGPLLILIDDPLQRIDWPTPKRYLFDELAQELLKHKAATKIVPSETIAHLRQAKPNFDTRGCREVGKMAGADQVLWIEIQEFRASEQIEDALVAAFFSVTLKVIDVNTNDRSRVRLWPTAPQGRRVTITLTGSEVSIAKTRNGIARKLTNKLASQTAKFFYDFRLGDFEREP